MHKISIAEKLYKAELDDRIADISCVNDQLQVMEKKAIGSYI